MISNGKTYSLPAENTRSPFLLSKSDQNTSDSMGSNSMGSNSTLSSSEKEKITVFVQEKAGGSTILASSELVKAAEKAPKSIKGLLKSLMTKDLLNPRIIALKIMNNPDWKNISA